jgi:hypothetical protein
MNRDVLLGAAHIVRLSGQEAVIVDDLMLLPIMLERGLSERLREAMNDLGTAVTRLSVGIDSTGGTTVIAFYAVDYRVTRTDRDRVQEAVSSWISAVYQSERDG